LWQVCLQNLHSKKKEGTNQIRDLAQDLFFLWKYLFGEDALRLALEGKENSRALSQLRIK
jgi:hypothetical protein